MGRGGGGGGGGDGQRWGKRKCCAKGDKVDKDGAAGGIIIIIMAFGILLLFCRNMLVAGRIIMRFGGDASWVPHRALAVAGMALPCP